MALAFQAAIRGNLKEWAVREQKAVESGVASAMRRRTNALKKTIRTQATRAHLGKLALAVRGTLKTKDGRDITRRGDGSDVTGRVYSKAITKSRPGGLVDLITVFDTGVTITARGRQWLAFPARGQARTSKPANYPRGALVFRQRRGATNAVLVFADRPTVAAFVLVKQARLRKRLNIAAAYAKAVRGLDALIAREVERRIGRAVERTFG